MDPIKSGAIFKLKSPSTTPAHPPPPTVAPRLTTWTHQRSPQSSLSSSNIHTQSNISHTSPLKYHHQQNNGQASWHTPPPLPPHAQQHVTPSSNSNGFMQQHHHQQQHQYQSSIQHPNTAGSVGKNSMLKQSFDRIYRATPLPPNVDREVFRPPTTTQYGQQPQQQQQQQVQQSIAVTTFSSPSMAKAEYTPPRFSQPPPQQPQQQQQQQYSPSPSAPVIATFHSATSVQTASRTQSGRSPFPAAVALPAHVQQRNQNHVAHSRDFVSSNEPIQQLTSPPIQQSVNVDSSESRVMSIHADLNRHNGNGKFPFQSQSTSSSIAMPPQYQEPTPPPVAEVTVRHRVQSNTMFADASETIDNDDNGTLTSTIDDASMDYGISNHEPAAFEQEQEQETVNVVDDRSDRKMDNNYTNDNGDDYPMGDGDDVYADANEETSDRGNASVSVSSFDNGNQAITNNVRSKSFVENVPQGNVDKNTIWSDDESDITTRIDVSSKQSAMTAIAVEKSALTTTNSNAIDISHSSSKALSSNSISQHQVMNPSSIVPQEPKVSPEIPPRLSTMPSGGGGRGRGMGRGMATDSLLAFIQQPIVSSASMTISTGSGRGFGISGVPRSSAPPLTMNQAPSSQEQIEIQNRDTPSIVNPSSLSSTSLPPSKSIDSTKQVIKSDNLKRAHPAKDPKIKEPHEITTKPPQRRKEEMAGKKSDEITDKSVADAVADKTSEKSPVKTAAISAQVPLQGGTTNSNSKGKSRLVEPKEANENASNDDSDDNYEEYFASTTAAQKRGRGRPRKIRPEDLATINNPNANKQTKSGRWTKPVTKLIDEIEIQSAPSSSSIAISLKPSPVKPTVSKNVSKPSQSVASSSTIVSSSSAPSAISTTSSISMISKKLLAQVGEDDSSGKGNSANQSQQSTMRDWQPHESVALYSVHAKTNVTDPNFWGLISQQLKQRGVNRTAEECEQKWFMSVFDSQKRREKLSQKQKATKVTSALEKIQEISDNKVPVGKTNNRKEATKKNAAKTGVDSFEKGGDNSEAEGKDEEDADESIDKVQPTKKRRLGKNDLKVLAEQSAKAMKSDDIFDALARAGQSLSFKRQNTSEITNQGVESAMSSSQLNSMLDDALIPDIPSPITTKNTTSILDKRKNADVSPTAGINGNSGAGPMQLFQSNHVHKIHTNRIRPQLIAPLGSKVTGGNPTSSNPAHLTGKKHTSIAQLQKKIGKAVDTVKREYRRSRGEDSDGESLGDEDTEEEEEEEEY